MTRYSLEGELAKKYGVAEAFLLSYFQYYIELAEKKQEPEKFHEGRYWTYASMRDLAKCFSFYSQGKIHKALHHLIDEKILLTGNFNKYDWDKTTWYAFSDSGLNEVRGCSQRERGVHSVNEGVHNVNGGVHSVNDNTYSIHLSNSPIRGNAREQTKSVEVVNEKHDPRFPGTKYSQEVYSQAVDAYVKFINLPLNANDVDEICCMVDECGLDASIHGLRTAAKNKVRKLSYAAACARNYVEDKGKPKKSRLPAKSKNDVEGTFNALMAKYGGDDG